MRPTRKTIYTKLVDSCVTNGKALNGCSDTECTRLPKAWIDVDHALQRSCFAFVDIRMRLRCSWPGVNGISFPILALSCSRATESRKKEPTVYVDVIGYDNRLYWDHG